MPSGLPRPSGMLLQQNPCRSTWIVCIFSYWMQLPVVQSPLFSVLSSGGSSFAPGSRAGLLQVDPRVDPWDPAWDGSPGSVYHLGAARNAAEIPQGGFHSRDGCRDNPSFIYQINS